MLTPQHCRTQRTLPPRVPRMQQGMQLPTALRRGIAQVCFPAHSAGFVNVFIHIEACLAIPCALVQATETILPYQSVRTQR